MDDLELLARWQAGDTGAGDELVARHFASVYRFFEHKVGEHAADLAQQTFLHCTRALDAFRRQASFRTYLFVIARNELHLHFRKTLKREQVDFESSSIEELTSSPQDKLERARERARLVAALRKLTVDQQTLLELHYWDDWDAESLAALFGLDQGAIRTRLSRARKALKQLLDAEVASALADDRLVSSLLEPDPG